MIKKDLVKKYKVQIKRVRNPLLRYNTKDFIRNNYKDLPLFQKVKVPLFFLINL